MTSRVAARGPSRTAHLSVDEQVPIRGEPETDVASVLELHVPIREKLWLQINGEEGTGFALSFVIHAILLAVLAIPVVSHLASPAAVTTIFDHGSDEQVVFEDPIDTAIPLPVSESAGADAALDMLAPQLEDLAFVHDLKFAEDSLPEGTNDTSGNDTKTAGIRIAEPKNAIRAGNFSVWCWPIIGPRLLGEVKHGTPGEFPRPGQHYSIVIRMRVPKGRSSVSIRDFKGTVRGTDSYRQNIPEDTFFYSAAGRLTPTRVRPRIPVIDGTVELIVRVPGANAYVRDTIKIYSEILDEEQELELIFQPNDDRQPRKP